MGREDEKAAAMCESPPLAGGEHREAGSREISVRKFTRDRILPPPPCTGSRKAVGLQSPRRFSAHRNKMNEGGSASGGESHPLRQENKVSGRPIWISTFLFHLLQV